MTDLTDALVQVIVEMDLGLNNVQALLTSLAEKYNINSASSLRVARNLESKINMIERVIGSKSKELVDKLDAPTRTQYNSCWT